MCDCDRCKSARRLRRNAIGKAGRRRPRRNYFSPESRSAQTGAVGESIIGVERVIAKTIENAARKIVCAAARHDLHLCAPG